MEEGALLAMLRQAEDRLRQLEYRLSLAEAALGKADQMWSSLRSANSS